MSSVYRSPSRERGDKAPKLPALVRRVIPSYVACSDNTFVHIFLSSLIYLETHVQDGSFTHGSLAYGSRSHGPWHAWHGSRCQMQHERTLSSIALPSLQHKHELTLARNRCCSHGIQPTSVSSFAAGELPAPDRSSCHSLRLCCSPLGTRQCVRRQDDMRHTRVNWVREGVEMM
jgi:hypothetical protein